MRRRIAIIITHPIQYYAPWFKLLAKSEIIYPKVFYTWEQSAQGAKIDPGFGKKIEWDIPLLEGYEYKFVKNVSAKPGSDHYKGIVNPSLINEINEWNPDAILIFGWNFHSHLKCMRFFHKKIPVFFRGDSTLLDSQRVLKRTMRFVFLKWVYRHIDYALYVGTNNKNYFLKCGLKEEQLIYIPHAIDNERFAQPDEIYRAEAMLWRKELEIKDEDIVVLFAGKLEPKKNPSFLLQLAKKCTNQQLKFIFVGNGILEPKLKIASSTDHRIIFINFQNQQKMPVVYRLGDIFILPSNGPGETWGLAVNEAMACGKPVMVSEKAGSAIDLVKEFKNGIIFNNSDLEKCINFINEVCTKKETIKNMGNYSRALIKEYSFERIANTFIDEVVKVCSQD